MVEGARKGGGGALGKARHMTCGLTREVEQQGRWVGWGLVALQRKLVEVE